jgi:hypothetical protein
MLKSIRAKLVDFCPVGLNHICRVMRIPTVCLVHGGKELTDRYIYVGWCYGLQEKGDIVGFLVLF